MRAWPVLCMLLWAQPALAYYPMDMWQAERKAAQGQWSEAAQLYRAALKARPESVEALYNLGLCHYRQGQFDKAEPFFKKALELAPPGKLKGQAAYNMGNTLFHQKKLKESLEPYKVALRWNELDDDARYNIQVVLDMLKEPPKDKDKDKKDKDKDKKDKDKDKKKKDQDKKDKDKKDKGGKDKDKGKPTPTPSPQPPQGSPSPTPSPNPQGQPTPTPSPSPGQDKPTPQQQREKEDAERLLQFFQNREKQAQKRKFPARPAAPTGADDW